jgi:hypothetical protein
MPAANKTPRLSVNKLGEYMVVGPARRRRIIYDAKFPSDLIRPFYTPAEEAIALFISKGMHDVSALENRIATLGQSHAETVWDQRRINSNIDAIESFMDMLDDVDLKGAVPALGAHSAPTVTFSGVQISVRPEITLTGDGIKGQKIIGAMKLHFPKSHPLNAEAAGYISAMIFAFCTDHLSANAVADSRLCGVIDVAGGNVHAGPAATKSKLKDLQAACAEIASLWPTVT